MKFLLLWCAVALLGTSCTTLSNRRDLYNPSDDAGPYNSLPAAHPTPTPHGAAAPEASLQPAPQ